MNAGLVYTPGGKLVCKANKRGVSNRRQVEVVVPSPDAHAKITNPPTRGTAKSGCFGEKNDIDFEDDLEKCWKGRENGWSHV